MSATLVSDPQSLEPNAKQFKTSPHGLAFAQGEQYTSSAKATTSYLTDNVPVHDPRELKRSQVTDA
jgi:hypothetical protein